MSIDPVKRRIEQSFEEEKLTRFIRSSQDIEELRQTALFLVQQLSQQKAAGSWMASRAAESENARLEMLAQMVRRPQSDEV